MKRLLTFQMFAFGFLLLAGGLVWNDAFAQAPDMQAFAEQAGFFSGDLRLVVARLIRTAISLAGIVLVIMLIVGAVQYMTAGGVADRMDKAKKTITRAIIGLVIVLSSFVIAQFVVSQVTTAVGGGRIGDDDGGCASCLGDGHINTKRYFALSSWNETCAPLVRNFAPQFVFTQAVARSSVSGADGKPLGIIIKESGSPTPVDGTWRVSGKTATFVPSNACPGQASEHCFSATTAYSVEFKQTVLKSTNGRSFTCGGAFFPCVLSFTTGSVVDTRAPTIVMTNPSALGASGDMGDIFPLQSRVQDETGASLAEFFVDDAKQSIFAITLGVGERPVSDRFFETDATEWNTNGYPAGLRQIWATGADCAGHIGTSPKVPFALRALTCSNGNQDGDETGIDCGGSCLACPGQPCTKHSDCAAGLVCKANVCVASPRIDRVTPGDGKSGNLVTITGIGFGSSPGTVAFLGAPPPAEDDVSVPPYAGCAGTWSDKQIIIRLEDAMKSGPIQVSAADATKFDRTDDDYGPRISDFQMNDTVRPGLCSITPPAGKGGMTAVLFGNGFGASRGTSGTVYYGNTLAASYGLWSETSASTIVPLLDSQTHAVQMFVGDNACAGTTTACRTDADCGNGTCVKARQGSNTVSFASTSDSDRSIPVITSIESGWKICNDITTDATKKLKHCNADADCPGGACVAAPNWGPVGQYLTIYGSKFGTSGFARFRLKADRKEAIGDTAFPEACGQGIWKDDSVVVKVPKQFLGSGSIVAGSYEVTVERSGIESAPKDFVVVDELPGPGICRVNPSAGPIGSNIGIFGEHFVGASGRVVFYDQKESPMIEPPLETSLRTVVPQGAATGPLFVERTAPGVFRSNSVNFAVGNCKDNASICGIGEQCCANGSCSVECARPVDAHYAYLFSTGPIPKAPRVVVACVKNGTISPSPWNGWSKQGTVCVDAVITAEFGPTDIEIDMQSVRDHLKIEKCVASGADPCKTVTPVEGGSVNGRGELTFTWDFSNSATNFDPDTTYSVTLGKGVRSKSSIVGGVETGLVEMGAPFSWQFKTSSGTCAIGALAVSPGEATITEMNGTKDYLALPVAKDDQCIVLSCSGHSVAWASDDSNKAEIIGRADSSNQCENTAKGLRETLGTPVKISAVMTDVAGRPSDDALLEVDFVDPGIASRWPDCDQACVNAEIGAAFNTLMDRSTISEATVHFEKCNDADCLSGSKLDARVVYPIPGAPFEMEVNPKDGLERNGYYRVTVDAGVVSMSGIAMKQKAFWIFRVKNSGELCEIQNVHVNPKETTLLRVGARQDFVARALSKPDECSVNGQRLKTETLVWLPWQTADKAPDKARAQTIGFMLGSEGAAPGEIKKFPMSRLPAECSSSCLNLGSVVRRGESVCGNGIKENGEDCDDRNVSNGDGCSSRCLFEPSLKCGKYCEGTNTACVDNTSCPDGVSCTERTESCCGDGTVQPFEACDPAKPGTLRCSDVCLNLGTNQELCGNGYKESGESCDSEQGCTTQCLHSGSIPRPASGAVCGNGTKENGEECDGGFGCGEFCLNSGTPICAGKVCLDDGVNTGVACVNETQCQAGEECYYPVSACCGNGGVPEAGEDCDDGNARDNDGCSARCLKEGSSVYYSSPSFCGDGTLGQGEECEAPSVGNVGPYGAIEISDSAPQEVDDKTGKAVATVGATVQGKKGTAEVALQCSCERDDACGNAVLYGCGKAKCCYDRPAINTLSPADGVSNRCRNVAISASFSRPMDAASFDQSVDANKDGKIDASEFKPNAYLEILKEDKTHYASQSEECPAGTNYAFELPLEGNWLARALQKIGRMIRSFGARDAEAGAINGCFVALTFKAQGNNTAFIYKDALAKNSWYSLTIIGDSNAGDGIREGVLSADSVGLAEAKRTTIFKTGETLCSLGTVQVADNGKKEYAEFEDPSPYLFTKSGERHGFIASALAKEDPTQPIVPTTGYSWTWSWSSTVRDDDAEQNIVTTEPSDTAENAATSVADVVAGTKKKNVAKYNLASKSGEETVIATATITTENPPKEILGLALVRAELCENPSVSASPFSDDNTNPSTGSGNKMNFSFFYCRDSGDAGNTNDDLNDVEIQVVPRPLSGILKEFLVKINDTKDAIGIRVAENPKYLTPSEWYAQQGFRGSPTPVVADGYSAVQDGATWYIAAPNQSVSGDGKPVIYSNIYIVSYNQNASTSSKEIFARILTTWRFNANLTDLQICRNDDVPTAGYYKSNSDDAWYVSCSSDQDCAVQKCVNKKCSVTGIECKDDLECIGNGTDGFTCDADKSKLQRDFKRVFDAVRVQDTLFRYGVNHGRCSITQTQTCVTNSSCPGGEECLPSVPSLETGSFVRSMSVSVWPSWGAILGNALGQSLPNDPINAFRSCSLAGFDPNTCYNQTKNQFSCSKDSFIYGFKSLAGDQYEWHANLEYEKAGWKSEVKKYDDPNASISLQYPTNTVVTEPVSGFTVGGDFCRGNAPVGDSNVCGDQVKGESETCEVGDVSTAACKVCYSSDAEKTGLSCNVDNDCKNQNICETPSGQTVGKCKQTGGFCDDQSDCINTGWACHDGQKNVACLESGTNACKEYQKADESSSACVPQRCGNGIVDNGETCDAGSRNGAYGVACSKTCQLGGRDTFYCGDGYLAGGEQCDCGMVANFSALTDSGSTSWAKINSCGTSNGQYWLDSTKNCSFDCKKPGPSCGDGIVNGGEECDPASTNAGEKEQKGIGTCSAGTKLCNVDVDCPSGETCGNKCAVSKICTVGERNLLGSQCSNNSGCYNSTNKFCAKGDTDKLQTICAGDLSCGTNGSCVAAERFCTRGDAAKIGNYCTQGLDCGTGGVCSPATCSVQEYQLKKSSKCKNICEWDTPSACVEEIQRCGDGITNGNEDCDDGDTDNTDECTTECKVNVCGDGYTYRGVESCDAGGNNGKPCDAPYAGLCNFCTVDCQYKTKTGDYCGDGKKTRPEKCDWSLATWLGCLKVTGTVSERDDTRTCSVENEVGAVTGAACAAGFTCRKLGVCGGGANIGKPCTLDSVLTSPNSNIFSCGTGFECVKPHCSPTCDAMCPFNFELATLAVTSPVANSRPATSIKLYSVDKGTPDSAILHFPACSAAQSLVADVDMNSVEKPDVDVVFVTDLSGSMKNALGSGTRLSVTKDALKTTVHALFEAYAISGAKMRIGLASYRSSTPPETRNPQVDSFLVDKDSEAALNAVIDSYSIVNQFDGTPTKEGIEKGIEAIDGVLDKAPVRFVVLMSDGAPAGGITEVQQVQALMQAKTDVRFFSAAVGAGDLATSYMAHMSSDECANTNWTLADECRPREGIEYAFDASTADGTKTMYQGITNTILGAVVSFTTAVGSQVTVSDPIPLKSGVNQAIAFPSAFSCDSDPAVPEIQSKSQSAPIQLNFTGTGQVELSKIKFTYCPARP